LAEPWSSATNAETDLPGWCQNHRESTHWSAASIYWKKVEQYWLRNSHRYWNWTLSHTKVKVMWLVLLQSDLPGSR